MHAVGSLLYICRSDWVSVQTSLIYMLHAELSWSFYIHSEVTPTSHHPFLCVNCRSMGIYVHICTYVCACTSPAPVYARVCVCACVCVCVHDLHTRVWGWEHMCTHMYVRISACVCIYTLNCMCSLYIHV